MRVHVQGMGLLGSLTAHRLEALGVPFTWDDTDHPYVAWKASTGLVYPAGDEFTMSNLAAWGRWAAGGWLPAGVVEQVSYVFAQASHPHGGRYTTSPAGGLTLAHAPAYTVNVPALVSGARTRYADTRVPTTNTTGRLLVAHGHATATSFMWGWAAQVTLRLHPELAALPQRPALYGKKVRQFTYAYPVAGEPGRWWAGSSLHRQSTPRPLDAGKHLARWLRDVPEVYRGAVTITSATEPVQGWRPRPRKDVPAPLPVLTGGRVVYPALWHSGLRWAPLVVEEALRLAEIGGTDR
ncbi:MAG: hypothetical protein ACRDRO_04060 [Pseudonocardiaceae bacterium]